MVVSLLPESVTKIAGIIETVWYSKMIQQGGMSNEIGKGRFKVRCIQNLKLQKWSALICQLIIWKPYSVLNGLQGKGARLIENLSIGGVLIIHLKLMMKTPP